VSGQEQKPKDEAMVYLAITVSTADEITKLIEGQPYSSERLVAVREEIASQKGTQ